MAMDLGDPTVGIPPSAETINTIGWHGKEIVAAGAFFSEFKAPWNSETLGQEPRPGLSAPTGFSP
jgi:hypothetical protein